MSSIPETPSTSAWQPIATAPRDGTDIIVGYDFASIWVVHVAFWNDQNSYGEKLPEGHEEIGWWSYIENSVTQTLLANSNMPTHWMPLPTPPNDQTWPRS